MWVLTWGIPLLEVDRAVDNLVKSGKMFNPPRRESLSLMGPRGFPVEAHGKSLRIGIDTVVGSSY